MCPKCNGTGWVPGTSERGWLVSPADYCDCHDGLRLRNQDSRPTECPTCGNGSGEIIKRENRPCCGSTEKGRENLCPCLYHGGVWTIEAISPCPTCPNGKIISERQNGKTYHYPNAPKQLRTLPERMKAAADLVGDQATDETAFEAARILQRSHDFRDFGGFAPDVRLPPDFLI